MPIALPVAVVAAAALVGGGAGGDVTPSAFAGTWQGHSHTLTITKAGHATEWINWGCCHVVLRMEFRLSKPRGTSRVATALATVTRVRVEDRNAFTKAPHVGSTGIIRLRDGVITETLTGYYYCRSGGWKPMCGA